MVTRTVRTEESSPVFSESRACSETSIAAIHRSPNKALSRRHRFGIRYVLSGEQCPSLRRPQAIRGASPVLLAKTCKICE